MAYQLVNWGEILLQSDYWLAWQIIWPAAGRKIWQVIDHFGSPEQAWQASAEQVAGVIGAGPKWTARFKNRKAKLKITMEQERLLKAGVFYATIEDPAYPRLLQHIADPPPVIFYKGNLAAEQLPVLAMVGSRKPTPGGTEITEKFAAALAETGVTIVSGMARGIDSAAHWGALKAGGRTVAVLGCGLDIVYPKENTKLMHEIAATGALISEFPLGTPPMAWQFPARNRIISGLANAVLVVEAAGKSGALITVDFALEQGREVLAVPGDIRNPGSVGTNRLIKQGARMVTGVQDIFEELGITELDQGKSEPETGQLNLAEANLLQFITHDQVALEDIVQRCHLPVEQVIANLTLLELKGMIRQLPGNFYMIKN